MPGLMGRLSLRERNWDLCERASARTSKCEQGYERRRVGEAAGPTEAKRKEEK